jgi:hypothetical protein
MLKDEIKKKIKKDIKNNLRQPGLTYQIRDPSHDMEITS